MAVDPVVVHDFAAQPGQTVALDRYRYWGNPGNKDSRERTADQTIGTSSSRNIVKDKVHVTLKELAQAFAHLVCGQALCSSFVA